MAPPVVLTIAGYDPSSGAGVTADIKTIAAHGCYGVSCITALTVQSTAGVRRVEALSGSLVSETLVELAADTAIAAVRIGMLGSGEVAEAVAEFLEKTPAQAKTGLGRGTLRESKTPDQANTGLGRGTLGESKTPAQAKTGLGQGTLRESRTPAQAKTGLGRGTPWSVVLDPILKASSGAELLDAAGVEVVRDRLLRLADVVTPNLDEAAVLTGLPVRSLDDMRAAAARLHELGARAVVITGGHLPEPVDLLSAGGRQQEFPGERIESSSTHGTGCAFATALACGLALGRELPEAVREAKKYVAAAIANAYALGRGRGPLNHLYRFRS